MITVLVCVLLNEFANVSAFSFADTASAFYQLRIYFTSSYWSVLEEMLEISVWIVYANSGQRGRQVVQLLRTLSCLFIFIIIITFWKARDLLQVPTIFENGRNQILLVTRELFRVDTRLLNFLNTAM